MNYETYGPFEIPLKDAKKGKVKVLDFTKGALREFWSRVDEQLSGLSDAVGCYIFATRHNRGDTPWYVGQTKNSFKNECFQSHKQNLYNDVFIDIARGTPVMILVARCTAKGRKPAKSVSSQEADYVEQLLISKALLKNSKLANIKNTRFFKELVLPGVQNNPKGKPGPGHMLLKSILEQTVSAKRNPVENSASPAATGSGGDSGHGDVS